MPSIAKGRGLYSKCVGMCVRGCTVGVCCGCVGRVCCKGSGRGLTDGLQRCFMGRHVVDVGRSRAGDGICYTLCSGNHVVRGVCSEGCCGGLVGLQLGVPLRMPLSGSTRIVSQPL